MAINLVRSALLTSVSTLAALSVAKASAERPSSLIEIDAGNAGKLELDLAKVTEKFFDSTGLNVSDNPLWIKFHEESGALDISDISGVTVRVGIDEVRSAPPNVRGGS